MARKILKLLYSPIALFLWLSQVVGKCILSTRDVIGQSGWKKKKISLFLLLTLWGPAWIYLGLLDENKTSSDQISDAVYYSASFIGSELFDLSFEESESVQASPVLDEDTIEPTPGFQIREDILSNMNIKKWNECVETGRGPFVRSILVQGGFRQPTLDEALAATCAESNWDAGAVGSDAKVGTDIGLCQINTYYQEKTMQLFGYSKEDLMNPIKNALVCKHIHDTQGGWAPWQASSKNHGLRT